MTLTLIDGIKAVSLHNGIVRIDYLSKRAQTTRNGSPGLC